LVHHVEIYVRDLEQTIAFWTPLLGHLGFAEERWSGGVSYVVEPGAPYVSLLQVPESHLGYGHHRKRIGLNHVAFKAESRQHVDEVRAWAKGAGHTLLYDERFPFATAPGYYAVFLEDPDRIKLEVVAPAE
jgi:catechol 2,3-dioxygenase-like lactoylglutathione lyase family enzyme